MTRKRKIKIGTKIVPKNNTIKKHLPDFSYYCIVAYISPYYLCWGCDKDGNHLELRKIPISNMEFFDIISYGKIFRQ